MIKTMHFFFMIGLLLVTSNSYAQTWNQIGNTIYGEAMYDSFGYATSISSDGTILAVGAYNNDGNATDAGHVRILKNIGGIWQQIGDDIDGDAASDYFGKTVSLSADGTIVAIGAPYNDTNGNYSGQVKIFEYNDAQDQWQQLGSNLIGEADQDRFGLSLSLSADGYTVAIGGYSDDNGLDSGHVRIFHYDNGTNEWEQIGIDIDGEGQGDLFGCAVSLSADATIVAIGAYGFIVPGTYTHDQGQVKVYHLDNGNWTQLGNSLYGENESDHFGLDISLSADASTLAVGAPENDGNGANAGHVRVFNYNNGTWEQIGNDIDGEAATDSFGYATAINGDGSIIAIGTKYNDGNGTNAGHIRVYENQANNWIQLGDDIDGDSAGYHMGTSVSISADGTILAAGADYNNSTQVFEFGTNLSTNEFFDNNLYFYPNPVVNNLYLQATEKISEVEVYNTVGKLLFIDNPNNITSGIIMTDFPEGIYYVRVLIGNKTKVYPIIKK